MRNRRLITIMTVGLAVATAGASQSVMQAKVAAPAVTNTVEVISPWTALTAFSSTVERPDRLCYWDFRSEKWIPADRDDAVRLRQEDPRPVYREPERGIGRCGQSIPAADIGAMGAIFGAFVHLATREDRESVSPS